ncbi:hypothetical protein K402DRAFT_421816 [Aulographum hederae CBS 113979]|uniref:Putative phospholipase n=1 Tax=Aulographum hederae CBS 113979 TaxID=1176131 RepID=A0A6G1GX43_9PEZI|nr:hypothetical protein K402DRAFT_421816 [Aulographum hederae CBS 113979]
MTWLPRLNPVPGFPQYTGPHKVGTIDIELPVADLDSPAPSPRSDITTAAFRVFYPCEPTGRERPVRWLPDEHQRGYLGAYARFIGIGNKFSEVFAYMPQLLYYTTIPAHRDAQPLEPQTQSKRWPVVIFSHGLGGSRNVYSHLLGSLASHGVVVIASDHRDGSAPISYIGATKDALGTEIPYRNMSHQPSKDIFDARDDMLTTRLWEMGLIHDAILKIDDGASLTPLKDRHSPSKLEDMRDVLQQFQGRLDVQRPGAITWAGHSFGAATTVQLLKSVFYADSGSSEEKGDYTPLYLPDTSSKIAAQITPHSPTILLDLWCFPLHSPSTSWLWHKPLPCYSSATAPGGTNLLGVLSAAFYNWRSNREDSKRALSQSLTGTTTLPGPHLFYPENSAHLSQSDFGILFPWLTKKLSKAEEPERTLVLNARAILEVMRGAGLEVAGTTEADFDICGDESNKDEEEGPGRDSRILAKTGEVRGWVAVDTSTIGEESLIDESVARRRNSSPEEALKQGAVLGKEEKVPT